MVEPIELTQKFRSRKWRLTLLVLAVAVIFAAIEMLTDQLSNILMALIVSYNGMQGLVDWQKARQ
jgi:hypothetical protein